MTEKKYNFGEKKEEYSAKQGKNLPVWVSPKYEQSKAKAIELIENEKYNLTESDFWILMNETKSGKMAYTGLIICHNGCLKINDKTEAANKFKPECADMYKDDGGHLVMRYICSEQGLYEFGEVSPANCKNPYPYAMVLKRLQDRVVLKTNKISFYGILSEAESDDFKDKSEPKDEKPKDETPRNKAGLNPNGELANGDDMKEMLQKSNEDSVERLIAAVKKKKSIAELDEWLENKLVKKEMNRLEKYLKQGFDSVQIAIKEFRFMNQDIDDSALLNEIGK